MPTNILDLLAISRLIVYVFNVLAVNDFLNQLTFSINIPSQRRYITFPSSRFLFTDFGPRSPTGQRFTPPEKKYTITSKVL